MSNSELKGSIGVPPVTGSIGVPPVSGGSIGVPPVGQASPPAVEPDGSDCFDDEFGDEPLTPHDIDARAYELVDEEDDFDDEEDDR